MENNKIVWLRVKHTQPLDQMYVYADPQVQLIFL